MLVLMCYYIFKKYNIIYMNDFKYCFKIILLGDSNCGKTFLQILCI